MEQWKDIAGYEGYYRISDEGRVWSVERTDRGRHFGGHEKIPRIDSRNRYTVELSKNGRSRNFVLARLVAIAFVPNPDPKTMTYVNHKDEDTTNNRADNLEWCTHKYNCNYGTRVERIKAAQNMAVVQYTMDGRWVAEYGSMHIAAEAIGKDAGHICDCCQGNRSCAYGFFWRYKDDALYQQAVRRLRHKTESARQSYKDKHTERARNVVQLTTDGRYVATHPSSKYAAQSTGACRPSIINCCNGRQQTAAGYRWMYEKDYKKQKRNI